MHLVQSRRTERAIRSSRCTSGSPAASEEVALAVQHPPDELVEECARSRWQTTSRMRSPGLPAASNGAAPPPPFRRRTGPAHRRSRRRHAGARAPRLRAGARPRETLEIGRILQGDTDDAHAKRLSCSARSVRCWRRSSRPRLWPGVWSAAMRKGRARLRASFVSRPTSSRRSVPCLRAATILSTARAPRPGTPEKHPALAPVHVDRETMAVLERPGELRIAFEIEHAALRGLSAISSTPKP